MNTHRIIQVLREAYPGCALAHLNTLIVVALHDGRQGVDEYISNHLTALDVDNMLELAHLVMRWADQGTKSILVNE